MNGGAGSLGSFGFGTSQTSGSIENGAVGTAMTNGTTPAPTNGTTDGSSTDDPLQPHSLARPMDASNTIGGNIIGVGSKVDKKSFIVYHRAKNYRYFEFLRDDTMIGAASAGLGHSTQNMNGANWAGTAMPNSTLPMSGNVAVWQTQTQPGSGLAPQSPPLAAPSPSPWP
ncbi:MAG: hypothetical protein WAK48_28690 [Candidatus Acidiferrum sp.]